MAYSVFKECTMAKTVDFYFDFGSPYTYCCLNEVIGLGAAHDCTFVWHPILLWTARKHFGMTPPMEDGPKAAYIRKDMERSAAFYGVPFTFPRTFGKSTHIAARLFYGIRQSHPGLETDFAVMAFKAHFASGLDISDAAVLIELCADLNIQAQEAQTLLSAQNSKDSLIRANQRAIELEVWGVPFFIFKGENFFGADRMPQLKWRLAQQQAGNP